MSLQLGKHLPGGPLHGWQVGAVFLPFLLPILYPNGVFMPPVTPATALPCLLSAIGLPFIILLVVVWWTGLRRGFPLWALPALGMLVFIFSAMLQFGAQIMVLITYSLPVFGHVGWPDGLVQKLWMMILVQMVFLEFMVAEVVVLLRIAPALLRRVRQEWTLLSFILYGLAILPALGNDEFRGIEGYQTAGLLILAAGAGLYLIVPRRWQRVLVLVCPVILSPAVISLGLYQAFPAQAWANPANVSSRLWEAFQPLLYLSPLPVLLLLAGLAPQLPWGSRPEPEASLG
jgi:hypothetical protein